MNNEKLKKTFVLLDDNKNDLKLGDFEIFVAENHLDLHIFVGK